MLSPELKLICWQGLATEMEDVFRGVYNNEEPLEDFLRVMWDSWLEAYDDLESALFEYVEEHDPEAVRQFHIFYGRDPDDPFPRDPRELLAEDPEYTTYVETDQTRAAIAAGKRIAKGPDLCYVCGKALGAGRAELLLRWEVPPHLQKTSRWGGDVKWMVRCLDGPCADPKNGARKPLRHPADCGNTPNAKPEDCIICRKPVAAGQGFLVPREVIPRWLWARPAFPGARQKRYYVVCSYRDS